jgi:hypothetical protein
MATINENISDAFGVLLNDFVDLSVLLLIIILLFIGGYIIGSILGGIVKTVLRANKFREIFIKYGAMTSGSWAEITSFLGQYIKWLVVIFILSFHDAVQMQMLALLDLALKLLFFIILLVVGWLLSGVLYKIMREIIENIGIENGLKKYGVSDALGGIDIPHVIATLIKLYVFLLFAWQGVAWLGLEIFSGFMDALMGYIPGAILGLLVIIASLIIADFAGDKMKKSKISFAPFLSHVVAVVIVIIGVTLALPKFGFGDIEIVKYSFLIIVLGIAIGLAIAMGYGLRDSFAKIGKKYEKEF